MAVTREQLEQAIKATKAKTVDPSLSDLERSRANLDLTKLAVAYKQLGTQEATAPLTQAANPETDNYIVNRMKVGFARSLWNMLPEGLDESIFDIDSSQLPRDPNAIRQAVSEGSAGVDAYDQAREEAINQKALEWFGADPKQIAGSDLERYAGIAAESIAADPVMSVMGSRGISGLVGNLVSSGVSAISGAIGFDVGTQVAEQLGATPEWQKVVGQLGSAVGGTTVGVSNSLLSGGLATVGKGVRTLRENRDIQSNLDKASDFVVSGNMRQVIDDIVSADPSIDKHVDMVKTIADLVPQFKVGPGIALYDNPVIKKNMETLLRESPSFRASTEASLRDLGNAIKTRQAALFGTASNADVVRQIRNSVGTYGVDLSNVNKQIRNIDTAIDGLLERVRTTSEPVDIGAATTRLIDAKEKALRAKNTAEYERLLNKYSEQGVDFPADSVQKLHEFVGGATLDQLFTPFPTLVNKMKTFLSPKITQVAEQPPSVAALLMGQQSGYKPAQRVVEYSPLSLRQLDSLKQEVNKAIRQAGNSPSLSNTLPALQVLRKNLAAEINNIPEFGPAYRAVDASFYNDIGIPFDSAGLSQLDSLRFNETVGTYLSKPERAVGFLSFVGDAGIPVVKDAILLRMRDRIFNRGVEFNPEGYAKFINENKLLIDTVPGLRRELNDIGNSIARMDATKARLDAQAKEANMVQADNFLKAVNSQGLDTAINTMVRSPDTLSRYVDTLKNLEPDGAQRVRQGIRTALVNKAFSSTEGAAVFIDKHPEVFSAFFGPGYLKNVRALADAHDILRRIDPSRMSYAFTYKEADPVAKATGNSIPQITSTLRDRIASTTQKASILLSRWFTKRTAARRDAEIVNLLSSPDALDRIAKTSAAYRNNQIDLQQFAKDISNTFALVFAGRMELAETGAEMEQRTPEAQ